MSRWLRLIVVLMPLIAVAGCSSAGPSDAEIESALKARVLQQTHDMPLQIDSVHKQHCTPAGAADAFECDVEVVMGGAMAGKGHSHVSLVKQGGAWAVVGSFSIN